MKYGLATTDRMLSNIIVDEDNCWLWQGHLNRGYGQIKIKGIWYRVHRAAYKEFVGDIPDGCDVDHTCHSDNPIICGSGPCKHRSCINPEHLESVTRKVHGERSIHVKKTECKNGHPRNSRTVYLYRGRQYCKPCNV